MTVSISAAEIAARLGLHAPTAEQRAVIEADPHGASIVVAGAGSGKTETMANRVVWLLANGHVAVPEVLGLTFTRKAAGELADRIRERVGQLIAEGIAQVEVDPLESAAVGTYNAFASSIYREHAMLIGREPDASVLGEASAWQLSRSVTAASADARLVELDASLDRVTGAVLELSRALAENVADSRDVRAFTRDFLAMDGLPIEAPRKRTDFATFTDALGVVGALPPLLDLADAYAAAKRERGYVEFSDQVSLALSICERHPDVVAAHRERARTVLLDEYQDTSVVQTRLLATLFRGHPVMAVGDPDQSIYGWRGASAANLSRFSRDFTETDDAGVYDLSTSWRNPGIVLDAANTIIAPLDAGIAKAPLAQSPFARAGRVDAAWAETIEEEADVVARWFVARLGTGTARTGALLCRTLANVGVFTAALRAHGVPAHVLGIAGLLDQPVIADLVCVLRVLHDPTAGSELIRVLGGARWRIGPADLAALNGLARWLADRDLGRRRLEAFDELLAGFADVAEHPTLGAFLGWLTEAEQRDRLAPRQDEPEPGAVQVLSSHGSKGLEWDVVAIPRLVDEELPSKLRTTKGWLSFGALPNDFRGDRDELPGERQRIHRRVRRHVPLPGASRTLAD